MSKNAAQDRMLISQEITVSSLTDKVFVSSTIDFRKKKLYLYILFTLMNLSLFLVPACIAFVLNYKIIYVICWAIQGTILVSFSNAAHESTHELVTSNKRYNWIIGIFWMLPLLLNFTVHKYYHLKHHKHTTQLGDPEKNFEYTLFPSFKIYFKNLSKWLFIITPLHLINWSYSYAAIFNRKTVLLNTPNKLRMASINGIILGGWFIAVLLLTIALPKILLIGYWIPLCFFMPIIAYLTAVPEHYGVDDGSNSLSNTRTILTNRVLSTIFWNFNYHTAHHYRSDVPFYSLPKVHREIEEEIKHKEKSYLIFHIKTIQSIFERKKWEKQ